jgi:hypothetical protein
MYFSRLFPLMFIVASPSSNITFAMADFLIRLIFYSFVLLTYYILLLLKTPPNLFFNIRLLIAFFQHLLDLSCSF